METVINESTEVTVKRSFFRSGSNLAFMGIMLVLIAALVFYSNGYYRVLASSQTNENWHAKYMTDEKVIKKQKSTISDNQSKIKSDKSIIDGQNSEIDGLNSQISDLKGKLDSANAQINTLNAQKTAAQQVTAPPQQDTPQQPTDDAGKYLKVNVTSFTGPDSTGYYEIKFTITNTSKNDISDIQYRYSLTNNGQDITSSDGVELSIPAGQSKEEDNVIQWESSFAPQCKVQITSASWAN